MIERNELDKQISDFTRRLDRLEAGTKPMIKLSSEETDTFTVPAIDGAGSENVVRSYEFTWPDGDVGFNPVAIPYVEATFSGGDSDYEEQWQPEHKLSDDTGKSYLKVWVSNADNTNSTSATVKVKWVYLAASSASQ